MKKFIWITFSICSFLFMMTAKANTTAHLESKSNGLVNVGLTFEEGYVGGVDLTLKVSGQVSLSDIIWNSTIANSYTKRYSYNAQNQTIRIIITTGDRTKNLVDKKGNATLATLKFKNNGIEQSNYSVGITNLTIVDAEYTSVIKNDLTENQKNFVIAKPTVEPSPEEKPSEDNKPTTGDQKPTGNQNQNGNQNITQNDTTNQNNKTNQNQTSNNTNNTNQTNGNTTSNNQNNTTTNNNSSDVDQENATSESQKEDNKTSNSEKENKDNSDKEVENKKKKGTLWIPIVIVIGVVGIIGFIANKRG